MADTKISELTSAGAISGAEETPVVQTGSTRKTTLSTLRTFFAQTFAEITALFAGGTFTDIGTPASGDQILIRDVSDSNAVKTVDFSEFGGGGAVDSVNSQTGVVVLDPDDLDDTSTTNKFTTAGDISKLAGIEAAADVTDEANVTAALDNATLTDVGTPASGDLIILQDASDSKAIKTALFSEFGGGGGGAVDSVNAQTGVVVLDPDDLDDTSTTNKFTTAAEITKLSGIEASADVTDEANVIAALDGATTTAVTPASGDKVLLLDASDSDNLKHALFSEFGGGGGGDFAISPTHHTLTITGADSDFAIPANARKVTLIAQDVASSGSGVVNIHARASSSNVLFDVSRSAISAAVAAVDGDGSGAMHSEMITGGDSVNIEMVLISPRDATVQSGYKGTILFNGSDVQTNGFSRQASAGDIDEIRISTTGTSLTGTAEILVEYDSIDASTLADVGTPASGDLILLQDASDSKTVKTALFSEFGGGSAPVDSVNGATGVVVLDPDDLDDTSTTNKFTTSGDISKLAGIEAAADVTDEANVVAALNGATTTAVTPASGDKILLLDASDSDNLKHSLVSDFLQRFSDDVGDGAATSYAITHNLGTLLVLVQVFQNSDGEEVLVDVTRNSTNQVTLVFDSAPTTDQYKVVVIG